MNNHEIKSSPRSAIAAFEPDIPQNMGALIRLTACLNMELHVIEPCGFIWNEKRMQRSMMDYFDPALIHRHNNWAQFKDSTASRRLILLTTKSKQNYTDFNYQPSDIFLLGRESSGVPDWVVEKTDCSLTIPLSSSARSLNLVSAAAMVAGEVIRQTRAYHT